MKNILIILALTVGLGIAGFVVTAMTMQRRQQAREAQGEPTDPAERDMWRMHLLTRVTADADERQTCAFIGAGAGAAIGLGLGICIAVYTDRRRKRRLGVEQTTGSD